jgi:hypothetical protein
LTISGACCPAPRDKALSLLTTVLDCSVPKRYSSDGFRERARDAGRVRQGQHHRPVARAAARRAPAKGRHLSTARAIRLLEEDGVETPEGLVRAPSGLLKRATVDRVLRASGLDHARVTRPIAAVRFQAKRSNELWHFDMSPSDLVPV